MKIMTDKKFINLIKSKIVDYFNKADREKTISEEDVYIVWSCKTLQNFKALASTTVPDGIYYEITYNGDKNETYFDVYKKLENFVVTQKK